MISYDGKGRGGGCRRLSKSLRRLKRKMSHISDCDNYITREKRLNDVTVRTRVQNVTKSTLFHVFDQLQGGGGGGVWLIRSTSYLWRDDKWRETFRIHGCYRKL